MENSPLNKLSAEIRNQIYELVLTSKKNLSVNKGSAAQPALTRVCKQIRGESLLLFYNLNTFSITIHAPEPALLLNNERGMDWHREQFHESIKHAIVWTEVTPKACHQATKSLQLNLKTKDVWYFDPYEWGPRSLCMRQVREELFRRGYGNDRLVLHMRASKTFRGWDVSRPGIQTTHSHDAAEKYFGDIGFKYVTKRHKSQGGRRRAKQDRH